ncbi:hypothetical protein [Dokdonella sp.]|uniref:hypothetical protein n=1 Tax=Dokdonella sp. TaxID=2291710 RepID=UPI0035280E62
MKSQPRFITCMVVLLCFLTLRMDAQAAAFEVTELVLPGSGARAQPELVGTVQGGLALSWVEKRDKGHRLRFSQLSASGNPAEQAGASWSPAQTIAEGEDWFVNWADTPHLVVFRDGTLWAHWLRKNGTGIYDYGVALVRSADQGRTWSKPIRLEPAGARLDYGFVSLWENLDHTLGIAWLDSRQKQVPDEGQDEHHEHHEHGGGAMMLRAASFDAERKRSAEQILDASTCDCCPTSVAMTGSGPVLAYRGRTNDEVRDIRLVRLDRSGWTKPISVHADNWQIAGCPVNGPAVVAHGHDVWVAWYTEAGARPSVRLARSSDAGEKFEPPLQVAEGSGLLGRVNLAMDAESVWMTWLVEGRKNDAQQLMLARFDAATGKLIQQGVVADLSARGRASGSPQIQLRDGAAWMVWTDMVDGQLQLRGARVRPSQ